MTLRGSQSSGSIRTWRRHFPLSSVDSVVNLIREILESSGFEENVELKPARSENSDYPNPIDFHGAACRPRSSENFQHSSSITCVIEPDLTLVSIILGFIENHLTAAVSEDPERLKPKSNIAVGFSYCKSSRSRTFVNAASKIPPSPLSLHSSEHSDFYVVPSASPNPTLTDETCSLSSASSVTAFTSGCDSDSTTNKVVSDPLMYSTSCKSAFRKFRGTCRRRTSSHSTPALSNGTSVAHPQSLCEPLHVVTDHNGVAPFTVTSGKKRRFSDSSFSPLGFPSLSFEEAERRYQEFHSLITTAPQLLPFVEPALSKSADGKQTRCATRGLIRAVCEVLRGNMSSGKGREKLTHTQSIYSFLTTGLLDSFGLAYTTVAACQLLGYSDVYLALSEEHGWVEFGPPDSRQTADVASWMHSAHIGSFHDTGLHSRLSPTTTGSTESASLPVPDRSSHLGESFNPPPIRVPPLTYSWLYVNGFPVVCHPRILAVAAAVTALQPGSCLSPSTQAPASAPIRLEKKSPMFHNLYPDLVAPNGLARHLSSAPAISMQLITLKHRLLWLFYNAGCLNRYPLGLTNLADLEDAFPTVPLQPLYERSGGENRRLFSSDDFCGSMQERSCSLESVALSLKLYRQAVSVTINYYSNQHVYPYTCLAGCLYRHGDHRGALYYWSKAAEVIGKYNHTSEDLEIYRELLDIATQMMPQLFRNAAEASRSCSDGLVEADPDGCLYQPNNILDDPQCLAHLLAFYDNLCLWEEGSPVPVLHVGWVDKLMVNLSRFSKRARRLLILSVKGNNSAKKEVLHSPMAKKRTDSSMSIHAVSTKRSTRRTHNDGRTNHSSFTSSITHSYPSPSVSVNNEAFIAQAASISLDNSTRTSYPVVSSPVENDLQLEGKRHGALFAHPTENGRQAVSIECTDIHSVGGAKVTTVLAGIYQDEEPLKQDVNSEIEEADYSPSPPPLVDFPTQDEFLTSLVEACDQRLLNPAFLWGMEPHVPFLSSDVSPEDALLRLLSALEPKSIPENANLFPTPPNSGGTCDSVLDNAKNQHGTASSLNKPYYHLKKVTSRSENLSDSMKPSNDSVSLDDIGSVNVESLSRFVSSDLLVTMSDIEREFKLDPTIADPMLCDDPVPLSVMKAETVPDTEYSDFDMQKRTTSVRSKTMEELFVHLDLHSSKMISIIELLRAKRLNASAIKLALTAQSQVCLRRSGPPSFYDT